MTAPAAVRSLTIPARFCGPPDTGNGGYVCGLVSAAIGRVVTVRLNRPIPLERPLELLATGEDEWLLQDHGQPLARVRAATLTLEVPTPPSYLDALDGSVRYRGFQQHPYPRCFVCGPARERGDGLRLFTASVHERPIVAAAWLPDVSLAGADGKVAPEFLSAALDCPGFFALTDAPAGAWLLGEFTAHVDRSVHVDESCVVIGWKLGAEGRKHSVGTALFDADGELVAYAKGVWIAPRELV